MFMSMLHDMAFVLVYFGGALLALEALKMIRQNYEMKHALFDIAHSTQDKFIESKVKARALLRKRYSLFCGLRSLPPHNAKQEQVIH